MKQTVVLTAQFPEVALRILGGDFDVIVQSTEGIHDEDEMKEIVADADGLISILTDPVTRGVLAANPNLRIVGNCAVGVDNIAWWRHASSASRSPIRRTFSPMRPPT
ncbi:MAG TPA: hypothetical protein VMT00_05920 [Thermoanaerobaculia bacterium]|nr:hypothetical protein [Thermoanaerobaculia bacterium]